MGQHLLKLPWYDFFYDESMQALMLNANCACRELNDFFSPNNFNLWYNFSIDCIKGAKSYNLDVLEILHDILI